MIFLEFLDGQGLGNQLWNYATLRSICTILKYDFKVINPEKFKGRDFLEIDYKYSNNKKNSNKSSKDFIFNEKIYYDNTLNSFASDFDSEILNLKPNTQIKGIFQSEKYFFKNDINQYFKIKSKIKESIFSRNKYCIINIRGGEYKRFKNLILPKSYWIKAMENMKRLEKDIIFYIVTDDYDYARKLLPKIKILRGNIEDDFMKIYYANYLIISNSSFAYFPIKLGKKPIEVIAPANWSRFGNQEGKWVSPANFYEGWSYQDSKGSIISSNLIHKNIEETKSIYSSYNVLTTEESVLKKSIFRFIPCKRIIKKFLSKLLPMHIG